MIEFALGFVAASVVFVFFPDLAVIPAGLLRRAWEAIKRRSPKE
jgi:hypothetical protein